MVPNGAANGIALPSFGGRASLSQPQEGQEKKTCHPSVRSSVSSRGRKNPTHNRDLLISSTPLGFSRSTIFRLPPTKRNNTQPAIEKQHRLPTPVEYETGYPRLPKVSCHRPREPISSFPPLRRLHRAAPPPDKEPPGPMWAQWHHRPPSSPRRTFHCHLSPRSLPLGVQADSSGLATLFPRSAAARGDDGPVTARAAGGRKRLITDHPREKQERKMGKGRFGCSPPGTFSPAQTIVDLTCQESSVPAPPTRSKLPSIHTLQSRKALFSRPLPTRTRQRPASSPRRTFQKVA